MAEEYTGEVLPLGGGPKEYTGEVLPLSGKPKAAVADEFAPWSFANIRHGLVEPFAAMGSAAVMKPVSEIAGLASMPLHAMGITSKTPQEITQSMQQEGIYQPKTKLGQALNEYNPLALLGKGMGWLGEGAEHLTAPPGSGQVRSALGRGVKEAVEQAPAVGLPMLGKMAEAKLPAKVAAGEAAQGANALVDANNQAFRDAGYIMPATEGVKAQLQGVTGKVRNWLGISEKNTENATRRLGEEVGVAPDTPLSPEVLQERKQAQYDRYDALKQQVGPEVQVTNEFADGLKSKLAEIKENAGLDPNMRNAGTVIKGFLRKIFPKKEEPAPGAGGPGIYGTIGEAAEQFPVAPAFGLASTIERAAGETPGPKGYGSTELAPAPSVPVATTAVPTLPTSFVTKQISELRAKAKDSFRAGDSDLAFARLGIANGLESLLEQNIGRALGPEALADFRDARKTLAQLHLLDRVVDVNGKVNLAKLAQLSESKTYKGSLTGEFETAADFAKAYRNVARKPTGEAVPMLSPFDGWFAIGSLVAGHPLAAAAELGGRFGIPAASRAGLLQNKPPSYGPSGLSQATPDLLRALGIGSEAYNR